VNKPIVAPANTIIDAPVARVWHALVTPDVIKKYMFGADVTSDWKEAGLSGKEHGKAKRTRTRA